MTVVSEGLARIYSRLKGTGGWKSTPPAASGRAQTPKYILGLESEGFVPAHRLTKRPTPWNQAVGKLTPKGTTVNEVIESAFARYARLEASCDKDEEGETEAAEHPPVSTGVAVRRAKRRASQATRRRLCTLADPCVARATKLVAAVRRHSRR